MLLVSSNNIDIILEYFTLFRQYTQILIVTPKTKLHYSIFHIDVSYFTSDYCH